MGEVEGVMAELLFPISKDPPETQSGPVPYMSFSIFVTGKRCRAADDKVMLPAKHIAAEN